MAGAHLHEAPVAELPARRRSTGSAGERVATADLRARQLLAIQRLAGNTAAQRLLRDPPGHAPGATGQSLPTTGQPLAPAPIPDRPMTRAEFEATMTAQYGLTAVRTGTLASQVAHLNHLSGPPTPGVPRTGDLLQQLLAGGTLSWSAWDPGPVSEVYNGIVRGFEDFARGMGGIPPAQEIVFYQTSYKTSPSPPGLMPDHAEGASYGAGTLTVYATSTTTPKRLPVGRDEPGSPAHRPDPGAVASMANYVAHELGHGLQEVALTPPAPDPQLLRDFQRAVGWIGGRLYDVGDPSVQQAAAAGAPPPPGARTITRHNWDSGGWGEQPLSDYMTTSAFEDFPEAVMAFVRTPEVLLARSPRRYEFLQQRRGALAPHLRAVALPVQRPPRPPVGDFPLPVGDRRHA
ncbi:MAG TPA: hypothetical protein VM324_05090 [Egibacteraceae bacterium]|nr:hypothetical protein [Egibacteraceae bacterium]